MIVKRALFWYYLYCVAGSIMVMPVYLILALSLNGGESSLNAKVASYAAVFMALFILPIWRFPNFKQNLLRPVPIITAVLATLIGYVFLSEFLLDIAMGLYPRGFTTMWLGPFLFVILLPFVVGVGIKTKHTFERIPSQMR